MYTVVILVVACLAAVSIAQKDECKKLEHSHSMHCCKKYNQGGLKDKKMDDLKECYDPLNKPQTSCEAEICFAKKKGYLGSDEGTADKSLFEAYIVNVFADDPDLVEAIKQECVKGDLINYGPAGACELIKLRMCILKQMTMNCTDWENKGQCKDLKELAEKCKGE